MPDALIVFDLDGTLVDSRQDLADSTNEVLESYGAPRLPDEAIAAMVGEGARRLIERALAAAGRDPAEPDALPRFHQIYARRLLVHTRPYDGIPEAVAWAAALAPLAVLTNKPSGPALEVLDAFGLSGHFRWVIGGDDAPRKPDPAGLERLIALAGVADDRVLMVGDSMIDIETARAAGVAACVALYGFGRARGELVLRGDEILLHTARDLIGVVTTFVGGG